jgi:hypothetical protein
MHETTDHLLIECNYTEAVWNLVSTAMQLPNYVMSAAGGPNQWVELLNRSGEEEKEKKCGGALHILVDDMEGNE